MRSVFIASLLAVLVVPAVHASAQTPNVDMRNRFGVKLMLGAGGEVETDTNVDINIPGIGPIVRRGRIGDDLDGTVGLGLTFEAPFHEYVTAGGIVSLASWNSDGRGDNNIDRYTMLDLDGFIKVRLPTRINQMGFEPYLMLPLGLSVNFNGSDDPDEVGTGIGWNTGLMLGAILFVGDGIGLNAEVGYAIHNVTHDIDVGGVNQDFDLNVSQGTLNLGIVFALD